MIERQLTIVNRLGLHARAAAKLVNVAAQFRSEISIVRNGEVVDGKSILGLLLLAAEQGATLTLRCDGKDENDAAGAIEALVADCFGEDS